MKTKITILLLFCTFGLSLISFSQYGNLEFVENKGQWNEQVKYRGDFTTGAFFLTENGFRVLQSSPDDLRAMSQMYHGNIGKQQNVAMSTNSTVIIHSHAYDVKFEGAGKPVLIPAKPLDSYNNYFIGNDQAKWKGNCRIFQAVTYSEMYKGVDVRYYTDNGRLKYDIIVHPGADAGSIAMKYEGADALELKNEELIIKTPMGDNREMSPYSFQVVNGNKKEVKCRFKISGNIVRFDLENYEKNTTLVIDPTLIFSTFTGSTADNWGFTATYGSDGSFFAGGIVFGQGFPVSPGAYSTTFNGGVVEGGIPIGYDIGIIKFNSSGTARIFATYIGGIGNEQPHSIIADAQGNLVIAGRSNSGSSYPLKNGPKVGIGGGYDIVVTKLNAAGTDIIGSRIIGGSADDGANIGTNYEAPAGEYSIRRNYGDDARSEVIFDPFGDILVASNTRSSDFPIVSPFQAAKNGVQDAVILKLSPDLSNVMVSSFLGGNGNDAAFVLALNPLNGKIYIGGNTESTDLPGDKTGVLQSAFGGGTDGFVSILSADATTLLKTGYFGTSSFDMLYGIQFDRFGFPYIMGSTTGNWTVKNAPYVETGGKQFISKLQPDLSDFVYSTVFGTNSAIPNISPVAFLVDRCENVYVSGWGGNVNTLENYQSAFTTGMGVTSNAIQPTTDGSDFYFFVLERNAVSRLYASFFGQNGDTGEHVDGGTSRFDRDGVIYQAICANCFSTVSFPTTPGSWSPQNPSSNCNLAAVKIAFNLSGIATGIRSSIVGSTNDTVGCVPLRVFFKDTLAEGKKYIWIYGDGSKPDTTFSPATNHLYNAIGQYQVTLISIDSSKCNIEDTSRLLINVKTFQAFLDFDWQKQLPCDSFKYQFNNRSTVVPAARPFGPASFRWDFGDGSPPVIAGLNPVTHSFPSAGTYFITLRLTDTNFCNAPIDTIKRLSIDNTVSASIQTDAFGCAPYKAMFINTSIAGENYFWNFGDGITSTDENPVHLYNAPGVYAVQLIVVNIGTCNKRDTAVFVITVSSPPIADFFFSPNPPQVNTPVDFTNTSTNADRFLWKYGDGDSLFVNTMENVQHLYNKTQVFTACLVAYNKTGCIDTVCKSVSARVLPLLDVPSAFSPNNDGTNDKIYVRGFGIIKMLWRIYNRWGTMVYESTDQKEGWNGKYKSSIQPVEVYHYTLDVGYSDNTTFQKKGDITLIR